MTDDLVLRRDEGAVTTLVLNRPDKLNALHRGVMAALRAHVDAIAEDPSVGCVVLTGAGRSFCAGHDLEEVAAYEEGEEDTAEAETIDALEALLVPTIASVRGHCLTGGLELALGCDLIVAAESARFADTHARWGLVPGWGMSVRLPERVGRAAAKDLTFTGRRVDGVEARRLGLAQRCVPDEELDAATAALAAEITASSIGSHRVAKQLSAHHAGTDRTTALLHERAVPYGIPEDMAERMAAG